MNWQCWAKKSSYKVKERRTRIGHLLLHYYGVYTYRRAFLTPGSAAVMPLTLSKEKQLCLQAEARRLQRWREMSGHRVSAAHISVICGSCCFVCTVAPSCYNRDKCLGSEEVYRHRDMNNTVHTPEINITLCRYPPKQTVKEENWLPSHQIHLPKDLILHVPQSRGWRVTPFITQNRLQLVGGERCRHKAKATIT